MKPIWFFFHVPKTGGQTIRDYLTAELGRDIGYLHLGRWDRSAPLGHDDVAAMGEAKLADLSAIGGHPLTRSFAEFFPARPIREFTIVREPAAQIVSHYNFIASIRRARDQEIPTFEQWLEERAPNSQCGALSRGLGIGRTRLSELLYALDRMWFVGCTERLDEALPLLFAAMALPPRLPTRSNVGGEGAIDSLVELTPDLADRLRRKNPLDVILHAACERLHDRGVARLLSATA